MRCVALRYVEGLLIGEIRGGCSSEQRFPNAPFAKSLGDASLIVHRKIRARRGETQRRCFLVCADVAVTFVDEVALGEEKLGVGAEVEPAIHLPYVPHHLRATVLAELAVEQNACPPARNRSGVRRRKDALLEG